MSVECQNPKIEIRKPSQLLLIDNDPDVVLPVKDYLIFRGYEVAIAENGRKALKVLEENLPDLIICDEALPGAIDGYGLIERIRQNPRTHWILVLFLSVKGQSQDRVKGLKAGADVYIAKPFEPEELVAQVESSLKTVSRLTIQLSEGNAITRLKTQVPLHIDLTPLEQRVLGFLSQGMSNKEIGKQIGTSQRTVEHHVSSMFGKTALHNRTELARWAIETNRV